MQRSKNIPDAINVSHLPNYTPIPNDLIRDPNISGKAKAILCLLLSNSNGWTSHVQAIEKMMKEGKDAIYSGLQELEIFGYFMRVKYRNKVSKKIIGNLWCYTNKKNNFDYKNPRIPRTARM